MEADQARPTIELDETTVKRQILSVVDYIASNVDLMQITDNLMTDSQQISQIGCEQIRQKSTSLERCKYLLLFVTRSSTTTPYLDFREALKNCGYFEVVQKIDSEIPVVYELLSSSKSSTIHSYYCGK